MMLVEMGLACLERRSDMTPGQGSGRISPKVGTACRIGPWGGMGIHMSVVLLQQKQPLRCLLEKTKRSFA